MDTRTHQPRKTFGRAASVSGSGAHKNIPVANPPFGLSDLMEKVRGFGGANVSLRYSKERDLFQVSFFEKGKAVPQDNLTLLPEEANGLVASLFSVESVPATSTNLRVTVGTETRADVRLKQMARGEGKYFNLIMVRLMPTTGS